MTKGEALWRVMAALGFVSGVAALALSLALWSRTEHAPQSANTMQTQAPGPAKAVLDLAGRTATLSRLLAERRAVARVQLGFGAGGILSVICRAEVADGGSAPCFGEEKGAGTWSLDNGRLCIAAATLALAAGSCYEVSGEAPQLVLAGPGLLAGNMLLR